MKGTDNVVIVGAGPAGIRATETLVGAGIKPVVIDEAERAGGQIYRQPPKGFKRSPEQLYGSEASKARALHTRFDEMVRACEVEHLARSSVIALADRILHVMTQSGMRRVPYDRLVVATGATDRLAPVPGWQSAGVFSLGATQIALKAQGVTMGREIVLAGSGPLLTLVATQLRKSGGNVVAVLDTTPMKVQLRGFSAMAARPRVAMRGLAMRAELRGLYYAGVTLEEIETDENGPVAIRWRDGGGTAQHTECDMVGLGWHLRPETGLADLAGCTFYYDLLWEQWLPRADRMGRAGEDVYLAGDGLRLLGADGAEVAGRLAAAACLQDMGRKAPPVAGELKRLKRMERFAEGLARAFHWPAEMVRAIPDSTVVCRCEGVTAGALRETASYGGPEANRVKSLGRVGMGRCQGRYCQLAGAELIAAQAGCARADVGRLRGQAPVRPAPISALLRED